MESLVSLRGQLDLAWAGDDVDRLAEVVERVLAHPHADEEFWLPEVLEELAQRYARAGRFDDAVDAQQRAIDHGARGEPDPRTHIAEFHLKAGRRDQAAALYAQLREQRPDDIWLCNTATFAYQDVDDHVTALAWVEAQLAIDTGDPQRFIEQLLDMRAESLEALGRPTDDDLARHARAFAGRQRPARPARWQATPTLQAPSGRDVGPLAASPRGADVQTAVGWFPPHQFETALQRWPHLAQRWDADDYTLYARSLQTHLLGLAAAGLRPRPAPIDVEQLNRGRRVGGSMPAVPKPVPSTPRTSHGRVVA